MSAGSNATKPPRFDSCLYWRSFILHRKIGNLNMAILRNTSGFGLSALAKSFCRAVFNQVPTAGIVETYAAERKALASLTSDERDELARERVELENQQGAVLSTCLKNSSADLFVTRRSFPILAKFQNIVESIEEHASQQVLSRFTQEERERLYLEQIEYARQFAIFKRQADVLSSKPGQYKIYLPVPPQKGVLHQRFEREVQKALERC